MLEPREEHFVDQPIVAFQVVFLEFRFQPNWNEEVGLKCDVSLGASLLKENTSKHRGMTSWMSVSLAPDTR